MADSSMKENEIKFKELKISNRPGVYFTWHTSRPPKKILAQQMGASPVPWDGDRWVAEALLAAPSNWDGDVNLVGCWLILNYCPALNDDCDSDDADDLTIPHDDSC
jgi:hypothetical protein